MTNKEAIEYLNTIGQYYSQDHSDPYEECEVLTKDELDAIYMAIKALEQQPTEDMPCVTAEEMQKCKDIVKKYTPKQQPCDDAVSRKAVDELSKELVHTTRDKADFLCNFWEGLQKLSPVTPQQKYGKWIDYRDEGFVECPFCGHATNCEDNIDELHYCFYCGACMKDGRTLDEFIEDSKESEEA